MTRADWIREYRVGRLMHRQMREDGCVLWVALHPAVLAALWGELDPLRLRALAAPAMRPRLIRQDALEPKPTRPLPLPR